VSRPDRFLFLIGAMRAGTTSLFNYLAQHPGICPARIKEPGYFAFEDVRERGVDWYYDLWDWRPEDHAYALEGSTYYTKAPAVSGVAEAIYESLGPECRFIYLVRHPLRRIESQVRFTLYSDSEVRKKVMFTRDPPVLHARNSLDHGLRPLCVDFSRYARQLEPYARVFGRDRILVAVHERMRDDPAAELARICGFLEIDDELAGLDLSRAHNRSQSGVDGWLWRRLAGINSLKRIYQRLIPADLRWRLRTAASGPGQSGNRPAHDPDRRRGKGRPGPTAPRPVPPARRLGGVDVEGLWRIEL